MTVSDRAGQPATRRCSSTSTGSSPPTSTTPPTRRSRPSGSPSAPRATAARRSTRSFNEAHILAITQAICQLPAEHGIDGPLFLGIDTHALSEPAYAHRARGAGRQRRRGDGRTAATATRRRRPSRTRSSPATAAARRAWPTASSSRRRTTRPRTAASSTTRRTAARPTPTSTGWIEDGPTRILAGGRRRRQAHPVRAGPRRDHAPPRLPRRLRRRPRRRPRHGRDPRRRGLRLGVDPLGGAGVDYWAAIAERYGLDLTVVNRRSTRPSAS